VRNPPLAAAHAPSRRAGLAFLERDAIGALVLGASLPFLFLHKNYQPDLAIGVSSTTLDIRLSDLAAFAVVLAAVVAAIRSGFAPLRACRSLWLAGALLLGWLAFETVRPASVHDDLFASHLVTAFKLGEYALLALAVPLLVRRVQDLTILLGAAVLWSALATAVALAQFFGLDVFGAWNPGWRQPSFLGHHDFASLSSIAVSLAAAGIVATRRRMPVAALFVVALLAGGLGLVLAGSVTAAAGFAVGAVVLALGSRRRFTPSLRRLAALGAVVVLVAAGIAAVRADSLADFMRFLGVRGKETPAGVESYSQRTVLAYIGLRIFEDHPVIGVGWQRSDRPDVFEPYLGDARRRFPDVVPLAFPSPEHPWGVQNLYIQMLADAGVVGFVLLLAVGATGLVLAWRTAARAPTPWAVGAGLLTLCGLLTVAGVWGSLGIVTGIPLQAATSLLFGLAAAGAARVEDRTRG
jgi:O-antigen ligase